MVCALRLVFELRFKRVSVLSDRPDILRKTASRLLADQPSTHPFPEQSQRFRSCKYAHWVAQRLVRARLRRGRQSEVSRIPFVVRAAGVSYPFDEAVKFLNGAGFPYPTLRVRFMATLRWSAGQDFSLSTGHLRRHDTIIFLIPLTSSDRLS